MNKFSIKVIDSKSQLVYGLPCALGQIKIGTAFKENFLMPLNLWSIKDYKIQWEQGLKRILVKNKSCLIISAQDFDKNPFINWWILYKKQDKIFIQNSLLFEENFKRLVHGSFDLNSCYSFIPKRKITNEDGYKISEWNVDLTDIINFLGELKKEKIKNPKKISLKKEKEIRQNSIQEEARL